MKKENNSEGKGLAIAAVVVSSAAMIFTLLFFIAVFGFYFDIFSPSPVVSVQPACNIKTLDCTGGLVSEDSIILQLRNDFGKSMRILAANFSGVNIRGVCETHREVLLARNETGMVTASGCTVTNPKNAKIAVKITYIEYYDEDSVSPEKTADGFLVTMIRQD